VLLSATTCHCPITFVVPSGYPIAVYLESHELTLQPAFNAYGLLLFGGPIELDIHGRGLLVDGWLRLRGWARIGVLVSRLRILLDEVLRKRIDNPHILATDDGLIGVVQRLVELNGQDQ